MPLRITATADVHLGMKFASYRELQADLVEARFNSLASVVEAGNDRESDLLIIAGDLFHRVGVAGSVVRRATEILREFEGKAVAVLPGNHDYLSSEGDRLWSLFRETAGDRTLVLDAPGPFDLQIYDLNAVILAAPCDSIHGRDNRVAWTEDFKPADEGQVVLGVAHGSIDGLTLDAEGQYFPMTRRLLASLPPDVWFVGHTHRQHDLPGSRIVVPGTPEPDGFDFPQPGQAAFVTIDEGKYSVDAVATGTHLFANVLLDLDRTRPANDQLSQAVPPGALVRLTLTGSLDTAALESLRVGLDELRRALPLLRVDDSAIRRLVTREDVDSMYARNSFSHALVTALLEDDDSDAAAAAVEMLAAIGDQTGAAGRTV